MDWTGKPPVLTCRAGYHQAELYPFKCVSVGVNLDYCGFSYNMLPVLIWTATSTFTAYYRSDCWADYRYNFCNTMERGLRNSCLLNSRTYGHIDTLLPTYRSFPTNRLGYTEGDGRVTTTMNTAEWTKPKKILYIYWYGRRGYCHYWHYNTIGLEAKIRQQMNTKLFLDLSNEYRLNETSPPLSHLVCTTRQSV